MSEKPDPMMTTMVVKPGWRPPGHNYKTLKEIYPFYLDEHSNRTCPRLHFVAQALAIVLLSASMVFKMWWLIPVARVQGYAYAWVGHFYSEHNKPATFKYPLLSFRGDWKMWWQMLT